MATCGYNYTLFCHMFRHIMDTSWTHPLKQSFIGRPKTLSLMVTSHFFLMVLLLSLDPHPVDPLVSWFPVFRQTQNPRVTWHRPNFPGEVLILSYLIRFVHVKPIYFAILRIIPTVREASNSPALPPIPMDDPHFSREKWAVLWVSSQRNRIGGFQKNRATPNQPLQ